MATKEDVNSGWDSDGDWEEWGVAEDTPTQEAKEISPVADQTVRSKDRASKENCKKNESEEKTKPHIATEKTPSMEESSGSNPSTPWGVWKPWGMVSSVLSTATEGLGNITSSVNQGLNQVIGVPDPEELARMNATESKEVSEHASSEAQTVTPKEKFENPQVFSLGLVATLGSKVLNTGLDTLEGIGKKTMNILQENDPMLMNKRKLLGLEPDRPNLSEVLKEAKSDADQVENTLKRLEAERLLQFESLFENNCGLVHFEALDILSKESSLKLQALLESVSGKALTDLQETINEVKELIDMEELETDYASNYDSETLNDTLLNIIKDVDLHIHFDGIVIKWKESITWISDVSLTATDHEIFAKGLTILAETCAYEMNSLHKIAELLLVKEHHSTATEVDCIVELCKHFHGHLHALTNRFAAALTTKSSDEAAGYVSTLFTELIVATQHIENAYRLFVPIIQIGAV